MMQILLLGRGGRHAGTGGTLSDGFSRGESLRLPPGEILAEEGVQHMQETGSARSVMPSCEEAYVVIRLNRRTQCYATWYPRAARWELLRLEDDGDAAPDARRVPGRPRRRLVQSRDRRFD